MRFEILTVTPEMAAAWFGKNEGNRRLRESRAAALARAIEDGKWILTHQPIALSRRGRLLDGQHRLRAVMIAGKAVKMVVAFDVADDAFRVMDAGLPRRMYERLRSDPRHTAICSTMFRMLCTNRLAQEYETALLLEVFEPALRKLDQVPRSARNKIGKAPQEAAIALRMAEALDRSDLDGAERINWKLERLRRGDMAGAPPVVNAYYRQLIENVKNDLAVAPVTDQFVRAWAAFDIEREQVTRLQINDHSAEVRDAREVFKHLTKGIFDE